MFRKLLPYIITSFFAVLIVSAVFYFAFNKFSIPNTVNHIPYTSPTPIPTPTPDPDRPVSVLLMGYGGGVHDGGSLTDSIILAQIQPHDQKIILVSFPRDLWVEVGVGDSPPIFSKINYAFPAGGGETSKKIVSQISGINIDYFLAMDFAGFTKTIDQLGGIDLKVTKPFIDKFYPLDIGATDLCGKSPEEITALEATMSGDKLDQQFTCRYEELKFGVGITHVDGVTALKFARSRHSETNGGDFNRGERQRQVILAIRDKVISLNFFTKIIPIIKTLSYHLHTDIQIADIEKYLLRAMEFSNYKVESYAITDKNLLMQSKSERGQAILIPQLGIGQYQDIQAFISSAAASSTIK